MLQRVDPDNHISIGVKFLYRAVQSEMQLYDKCEY